MGNAIVFTGRGTQAETVDADEFDQQVRALAVSLRERHAEIPAVYRDLVATSATAREAFRVAGFDVSHVVTE